MLMNDNALPIYKFTSVQLTQRFVEVWAIGNRTGNFENMLDRLYVQEGSPDYGIRIVARFASYSRCDRRKF